MITAQHLDGHAGRTSRARLAWVVASAVSWIALFCPLPHGVLVVAFLSGNLCLVGLGLHWILRSATEPT